jgi:hypothetical protein
MTKQDSMTELLFGPLALCCAIAVFLAAAFDLGPESPPALATIVQGTP